MNGRMKRQGSEYVVRKYREFVSAKGLDAYRVAVSESDLLIMTCGDLSDIARKEVIRLRRKLREYIAAHPCFQSAFLPIEVEPDSPKVVQMMADAAKAAGVGPMAAVAGAIAECVGRVLLQYSPEVIIENGGDIFISSSTERTVRIFAGDSPLSNKVGVRVLQQNMPCGICTSSGTVGPSISLGVADAVVALARQTPLADAAATAICNKVSSRDSIKEAIHFARHISGLSGVVIIKDDVLGVWGEVELVSVGNA